MYTRVVFVFGSNLAGRHGKGAALYARQHFGAEYGNGRGIQGDSYAIPTKDKNLISLPLETIKFFVEEFIEFAEKHPDINFTVTKIGTGLAGYTSEQIAPMFKDAPPNCDLDDDWETIIAKLPSNRHGE